MDAILGPNSPFIFMQNDYMEDDYIVEKATLWIVEGETIRPTTNLSIQNKLNPGVYTVEVTREYGLYCKKSKITSDNLIHFSNSVVSNLIKEINLFWDKKELYKANDLIHKRGILLEGFPGTGKTSVISLLSEEVIKRNGIVFRVTGPKNLSLYIDFIQNSFRAIEPETPIITIIEEFEKYQNEEMLLDFLDGKSNINHHVVIATTNNTRDIVDAYLRPSRIDLRLEIPFPCALTRREYFASKNISEEHLEELVNKTEKLTLADLKEIYIASFMLGYTIEEAIKKVTNVKTKKNYMSKSLEISQLGL